MAGRPSGADRVGMSTHTLPRPVLAAGGALVVATPVVTWWVSGDLSEGVHDPDYMVRPLPLSRVAETAIGTTAAAIALAALVVVVRSARRHEVDRRWLAVLGPLVAAGVVCGFGWRVVTAGVIGANIGGGMVMLFAPWVVLGLVIAAAVQGYGLCRER